LIGDEKATASHQVGEVVVVEENGSEGVERGQVSVPTRGRASGSS